MDAFAVTDDLLPEPLKGDEHNDQNSNLGEDANKFQRAISVWRGKNFYGRDNWRLFISNHSITTKNQACRY